MFCDIPDILINISNYLHLTDQYSLAVTNKEHYKIIQPNIANVIQEWKLWFENQKRELTEFNSILTQNLQKYLFKFLFSEKKRILLNNINTNQRKWFHCMAVCCNFTTQTVENSTPTNENNKTLILTKPRDWQFHYKIIHKPLFSTMIKKNEHARYRHKKHADFFYWTCKCNMCNTILHRFDYFTFITHNIIICNTCRKYTK